MIPDSLIRRKSSNVGIGEIVMVPIRGSINEINSDDDIPSFLESCVRSLHQKLRSRREKKTILCGTGMLEGRVVKIIHDPTVDSSIKQRVQVQLEYWNAQNEVVPPVETRFDGSGIIELDTSELFESFTTLLNEENSFHVEEGNEVWVKVDEILLNQPILWWKAQVQSNTREPIVCESDKQETDIDKQKESMVLAIDPDYFKNGLDISHDGLTVTQSREHEGSWSSALSMQEFTSGKHSWVVEIVDCANGVRNF